MDIIWVMKEVADDSDVTLDLRFIMFIAAATLLRAWSPCKAPDLCTDRPWMHLEMQVH